MLNKAKHKTRLTQNKSKTHKLCKKKKKKKNKKQKNKEREESDRITRSPFPSTLWKNLSFD